MTDPSDDGSGCSLRVSRSVSIKAAPTECGATYDCPVAGMSQDRMGSPDAFRRVFGHDLDPTSITAAAGDPRRTGELLLEDWGACVVRPQDIPALESGEMRPFLAEPRSMWAPSGFAWAERELDRLTSALTYAHRAVICDPLSYVEPLLRADKLTAANLVAILHVVAFVEPLAAAGIVWMVPKPSVRVGLRHRGPWPTSVMLPWRPAYHALRWFEDRTGIGRVESEFRFSSGVRDSAWGREVVIDLVQQTNALNGKAHLLMDSPPFAVDWDSAGDERRSFERRVARASRRARRRYPRAFASADETKKLALLLGSPLPNMSCVTTTDVIALRESNGFTEVRHSIGDALERYETAVIAGRTDAGSGLAAEFRATAEALEGEIKASSALASMRRGLSTFGVTAATELALAVAHVPISAGEALALPAVAGGIDYVRALLAASHDRREHRGVEAHASIARAVANRLELL